MPSHSSTAMTPDHWCTSSRDNVFFSKAWLQTSRHCLSPSLYLCPPSPLASLMYGDHLLHKWLLHRFHEFWLKGSPSFKHKKQHAGNNSSCRGACPPGGGRSNGTPAHPSPARPLPPALCLSADSGYSTWWMPGCSSPVSTSKRGDQSKSSCNFP